MIFHKISLPLISFQIFIGALGLSIGSFIGLSQVLNSYSGKIFKHTYISGIEVSSTTSQEASSHITQQYIEPLLKEKLTFKYNGEVISVPFEQFITGHNLDEVINKAITYTNNMTFADKLTLLKGKQPLSYDLHFTINDLEVTKYVDSFISSHRIDGQNAGISITEDGKIRISPSKEEIIWDKQGIITQIHNILNNQLPETINLDTYKIVNEPDVTTEELSQINSLVSSYSTVFSPSADNATNISLAAKNISNTLLMPGDTFSFNDIIGNTTLEKGYVHAPVIVNSKIVQGVGGGVCQVSSTLYNAILLAGLTASERQPHSKPSTYVPLGMDATIDWGNIDFTFENTLPYPIYIVTSTDNGTLCVDLYSNEQLKSTTYELSNEVYETIPSPVQYINDSSLEKGKVVLSSSGSEGYKLKVFRKSYKDDELVESTVISSDAYQAVPTIYKKGTR